MKDITPNTKFIFRFYFTTLFLTELAAFIHRFYPNVKHIYFFLSLFVVVVTTQIFIKQAIC